MSNIDAMRAAEQAGMVGMQVRMIYGRHGGDPSDLNLGKQVLEVVAPVYDAEKFCREDGHRYHVLPANSQAIRLYCRRCGTVRDADS